MPAPYPTYHVGDRVIVRQWDDMMEEFGSNPYGDITVHPNKLSFILDMKPYCGSLPQKGFMSRIKKSLLG